jgi:tetratricopeptide (TPR) repeat protein
LDGDLEGALGIYEGMYQQDSSAPIVANNYASLLSMLRDDDASIEKAYSVARRLQGIEVPAFQDTFGWIAYLRGEHATAVEHLEPAAAGLTEDPSVQYHLALAYEAVGRTNDAVAALKRAIALVEGGKSLPEIDSARQKLAELESGAD